MVSSYYKPCVELDACLELDKYWHSKELDKYWHSKEFDKWFEGYLKIANSTHYALAECQVGYAYLEGIGVEKNYQEALRYTHMSALHGDRDGQCNLAWIYEEGLGVEKDIETAKFWYQMAANQNHDLAIQKCKELEGK